MFLGWRAWYNLDFSARSLNNLNFDDWCKYGLKPLIIFKRCLRQLSPSHNLMKVQILIVSLLITVFSSISFIEPIPIQESSIFDNPIMCFDRVGRCVGSIYCTACTNCKYCGYCNSGGSCGVCGKRTKKYHSKPKKTTLKTSQNNNGVSTQKKAYLTMGTYIVIEKTSLRIAPNSKSKVLRRFSVNDKVYILDGYSEKYWCKVSFNEEIGWVKKHLLKKLIA